MSLYPFNLTVPCSREKTTGIPRNHTNNWATLQGCCFMQLIYSHGRTTSMSKLLMIRNWKKTLFFPYSDIRSVIAWEKLFLGAHLESPEKSRNPHGAQAHLWCCASVSKEGDTSLCYLWQFCKAFAVTLQRIWFWSQWHWWWSEASLVLSLCTGNTLSLTVLGKGGKVRQLQYLRGHAGDSSI